MRSMTLVPTGLRVWAVLLALYAHAALAQMPGADVLRGNIGDRVQSELGRGQAESIYGRLVKPSLTIGATRGQLKTALYQRSNSILLHHFTNGTLLVWDFEQGAQVDELALPAEAVPVYYDATAAHLYAISRSSLVRVRRSGGATPATEVLLDQGVTAAAASGDGRWIFAGTAAGELVKMAADGKVAWRRKAFGAGVREVTANSDGAHAAALSSAGEVVGLDETGSTRLAPSGIARLVGYDRTGQHVKLLSDRGVVSVPAKGGAATQQPIGGSVESVSMNDQGDRYIAIMRGGRLTVAAGSGLTTVDEGVKYGAFLDNKRYLYVKNNGVTYLRSLDLAHYLLSIVPSPSGWAIVDHEGRYDGTVVGSKDISWKADAEVMSLDQFFEAYYQPGLLASYLREQEGELSKPPADVKRGIYPSPKIELDFPEKTMRVGKEFRVVAIAQSRGGEFSGEIRLFHNGKRLPPKGKVGSQIYRKGDKLLLVEVFAFVPGAGLNEVYAEVNNSHGLTGRSEVKKVLTEGHRPSGKLRILGIGVDKYKVSRLNLNYAVADVSSVMSRIQGGARGYYTEVLVQKLSDEGATRAGIKTLLDGLRHADPQDSLIVVMAGHGDTSDGEWYFLPHDLNPDAVPATGVSAREIQDALVGSPAGSIFLIVDACNSGAGIDSFNRYRNFQRRFAQQMGRSAGVAVLTAARRDQYALESRSIGHGLFTHTLLAGLAGAADVVPKDNKVSAHEIARYVAENLRQRALQLTGAERMTQDPAHFVIGADFLISDVQR